MTEQNLSRLLLVSLIFLIITILCGYLIRNFSLIYNYQLLPIKDYIITTFITGSLIFLVNHYFFKKIIILNKVTNSIIIWSLFILLLIFLIFFADLEIYLKWAPYRFEIYKNIYTNIFAFILTLLLFFFSFNYKKINHYFLKFYYVFLFIITFYLSSFLIINEFHRYNQNPLNFQIVINPIIQVYLGKSSFLDFPSMYGHYGELIGLILKPFELSILNITIIISLIFFINLISIGYFLSKVIRSKLLLPTGFIFYIYLHIFSSSIWPAELYLQYIPLRTFIPSLAILFSFLYFKNPSKEKLYFIYILLSFGIYWNADTGLICFFGFFITRLLMNFYNNFIKNFYLKKIFKELFLALSIFSTMSLIIFIYIKLIYGHFPSFDFLMPAHGSYLRDISKLQLSGLWVLTIFVYIFSLFYSLSEIKKNQKPIDKSILFLSLIGIGLFSYHANQHYSQVLANVFYPFVLLIIIFLDKLLVILRKNKIKFKSRVLINKKFNPIFYISLVLVYFISFIFISFFLNLNNNLVKNHVKIYEFYYGKKEKILWEVEGNNGDKSSDYIKINQLNEKMIPRWLNLYNKIKNFTNHNEQIIIFSMWDSYLHMKLKIPQSINIVNSAHLWVGNRYEYILKQITSKKNDWIFFDEDLYLIKYNEEEWKKIINAINKNYKLIKIIKMDKTWWNGWKETELKIFKK
tara:strand:- start:88 stop:2154 length:2067 start_codon:yes stop_codon:yes gene_type:complete